MQTRQKNQRARHAEKGNILFMILLAVVLIGLVTIAIQSTNRPEGANIDNEELLIRATEVQRYASELERAVMFILQNGKSESDIRFAHPEANSDYGDLSADADPSDQVFHRDGGAATYRAPPEGINDGSAWEFYAGTALPEIGSGRTELVAVLPNVTQQFCEKINSMNGQTADQPEDTGNTAASGANPGSCIAIGALGRFDDSQQFYTTTNTIDDTTITVNPALQACIQCEMDGGSTSDEYHFYHVLLAR